MSLGPPSTASPTQLEELGFEAAPKPSAGAAGSSSAHYPTGPARAERIYNANKLKSNLEDELITHTPNESTSNYIA